MFRISMICVANLYLRCIFVPTKSAPFCLTAVNKRFLYFLCCFCFTLLDCFTLIVNLPVITKKSKNNRYLLWRNTLHKIICQFSHIVAISLLPSQREVWSGITFYF